MSVDISRFSDSLENLARPRQAEAHSLDPKHPNDPDADSHAVVVHVNESLPPDPQGRRVQWYAKQWYFVNNRPQIWNFLLSHVFIAPFACKDVFINGNIIVLQMTTVFNIV